MLCMHTVYTHSPVAITFVHFESCYRIVFFTKKHRKDLQKVNTLFESVLTLYAPISKHKFSKPISIHFLAELV